MSVPQWEVEGTGGASQNLPTPPRYQHLKSLPASLSLEQLSLTGSAALEEAGGTVAGDGGPGGVLSGTQSLEEGTDLETSPS